MIGARWIMAALCVTAGGLLSACGQGGDGEILEAQAKAPTQAVREIDWYDLLPQGEEDRLKKLYDDFYAERERELRSRETPLSEYQSDSFEIIEEGSALDQMPQLGTFGTVAELDGAFVRLPGFIVPLDPLAPDRLKDFLFVPYFGACIHTPPPPPNQIVYVRGEVKLKGDAMWMPYYVEGTLRVERTDNELGNTAYTMDLYRLVPYE